MSEGPLPPDDSEDGEEFPAIPLVLRDMLGDAQAAMRARSLLDVVEAALKVKEDHRREWGNRPLGHTRPNDPEITDAEAIDRVFGLMELVRQRHRVRHLTKGGEG